MNRLRRIGRGLGAAFLLAVVLATAMRAAHSYPDRVVRLIVPAAPGGALDTIARLLAQKASENWGHQIIVDNRPGANYIVGMGAVARAAPDGYTLLFVSSGGLTVNPYVFSNMTVKPLHDLLPVMLATSNMFGLLVGKSVQAQSVGDFIAYLRANPGKLNHGSNSATTMLVSELFKSQTNVDYQDVNYRGASQAMLAALEGAVQFCFVDYGSALIAVKAGQLRLLAVTGDKPAPQTPEVSTLAAEGVTAGSYTVLMAPPSTPPEVVGAINAAFKRAIESPDVSAKLEALGQQIIGDSPADAMDKLVAEASQWEKLIKARHIQLGG
jgi:tripartite-type tricarboxylate transporter receptor subunit TctC